MQAAGNCVPFDGMKYTGNIDVRIYRDTNSGAEFIRVTGERILLECFQGEYAASLLEIFGEEIVTARNELRDLSAIFASRAGMGHYMKGGAESEERIRARIEKDASRPYHGNVFTGFAVVEKVSNKIIGRVGLGDSYEPGECQGGLIIEENYRRQGFGKEAICLAAALGWIFYDNGFEVGETEVKAPVKTFTATAMDTNTLSIAIIKKLGLKYMRHLTDAENYSPDPRSLYGIDGLNLRLQLKRLIDITHLNWCVTTIG